MTFEGHTLEAGEIKVCTGGIRGVYGGYQGWGWGVSGVGGGGIRGKCGGRGGLSRGAGMLINIPQPA